MQHSASTNYATAFLICWSNFNFNFNLFTCKLNSPQANYKASTRRKNVHNQKQKTNNGNNTTTTGNNSSINTNTIINNTYNNKTNFKISYYVYIYTNAK
jgi:hypothetical protein